MTAFGPGGDAVGFAQERSKETLPDRERFGLGLAIARQAVDAHGGSIRVQNLPGKGCIFVLELPVTVSAPEL